MKINQLHNMISDDNTFYEGRIMHSKGIGDIPQENDWGMPLYIE